MPLNKAQLEFIEGSISYLFTSDNVRGFRRAFNSAFLRTMGAELPQEKLTGDFKDLAEIIFAPQRYFSTLENYNTILQDGKRVNAVIYISEIQEFLLYYALNFLWGNEESDYSSYLQHFNLDNWIQAQPYDAYLEAGWDILETLNLFNSAAEINRSEKFSSSDAQAENKEIGNAAMGVGSKDWSVNSPSHKIFTPKIVIEKIKKDKDGKVTTNNREVVDVNYFLNLSVRTDLFEKKYAGFDIKDFKDIPGIQIKQKIEKDEETKTEEEKVEEYNSKLKFEIEEVDNENVSKAIILRGFRKTILKEFERFPAKGNNDANDIEQTRIKESAPAIAQVKAIEMIWNHLQGIEEKLEEKVEKEVKLEAPSQSFIGPAPKPSEEKPQLEDKQEVKTDMEVDDDTFTLSPKKPGMRLLVNKYYYDKLEEKKIISAEIEKIEKHLKIPTKEIEHKEPLNKIIPLNLDIITLHFLTNQRDDERYQHSPETLLNEVDALCNSSVIKLLETFSQELHTKIAAMNNQNIQMSEEELRSEITYFEKAKKLSAGAILAIRSDYFFTELLEKRLDFTDFDAIDKNINLDIEKGKCIALPTVTRLVSKNVFSLAELKNLPLPALQILQIAEYGDMLLKHRDLKKFFTNINDSQKTMLLHDNILKLISRDKISLLAIPFMSQATFLLITHPFYMMKFLNDELRLIQVEKANEHQVNLCLDPAMIKLFDADIITMEKFLGLKLDKAKNLTNSKLNEALIAKEVTLNEALSLTTKQYKLFERKVYYKKFHRRKFPFNFFTSLNDERIDLLLTKTLEDLARNNILLHTHITRMSIDELKVLAKNNVCYLLLEGALKIEQVRHLSATTINLIENLTECCDFLKEEIKRQHWLGLNPISQEITCLLWAYNINRRMQFVFMGTPALVANQLDTPDILREQLNAISSNEHINHNHLLAETVKQFMSYLQSCINSYCQNISYLHVPPTFYSIKNKTDNLSPNGNDQMYIDAFKDIKRIALTHLQQPTLAPYQARALSRFFQLPPALAPENVINFSKALINFDVLTNETPQLENQQMLLG